MRSAGSRISTTIALSLLLALLASVDARAAGVPDLRSLPNGLKVVLFEDHTVPYVAVSVWVASGSKHETETSAGYAHFLEKLIQRGTASTGPREYLRRANWWGGAVTVRANYDRTTITATGVPSALRSILEATADMSFRATLISQDIAAETAGLSQQIRNYYSLPASVLFLESMRATFPEHPYRFPRHGNLKSLGALKPGPLSAFYHNLFVPNNMVVAVAGDFRTRKALDLVKATFGSARRSIATPAIPPTPTRFAGHTDVEKRVGLKAPRLALAFAAPGYRHPDRPTFDILVKGLGDLASSPLAGALKDAGLGDLQDLSYFVLEDTGMFYIAIKPSQADVAYTAATAVLDELLAYKKRGLSKPQVDRLVAETLREDRLRAERLSERAERLAEAALFGGLRYYWDRPEIYRRVTPNDIRRVAQRFLITENLRLVLLLPEDTPEIASRTKQVFHASLDRLGGSSASTPGFDAAQFRPGEASRVTPDKWGNWRDADGFAKPDVKRLENGLTIISLQDRRHGLAAASLHLRAGSADDPEGKEGLAYVALRSLAAGLADRPLDSAPGSASRHLKPRVNLDRDLMEIHFRFEPGELRPVLAALAAALQQPRPAATALAPERSAILMELARRQQDAASVGLDLFKESIYAGHPYAHVPIGNPAGLNAVTPDDLSAFRQEFVRPSRAVLAIVGDIDPEGVSAAVTELFAAWNDPAGTSPSQENPAPGARVSEEDSPRATARARSGEITRQYGGVQSRVLIGVPGVPLIDEDFSKLRFLGTVLTVHVLDELIYGRQSAFSARAVPDGLRDGGSLVVEVVTPRGRSDQALADLQILMRRLALVDLKDHVVEELGRAMSGSRAAAMQGVEALAGTLAYREASGLGAAGYRDELEPPEITAKEIKAIATRYLKPESWMVVTIGPPSP